MGNVIFQKHRERFDIKAERKGRQNEVIGTALFSWWAELYGIKVTWPDATGARGGNVTR